MSPEAARAASERPLGVAPSPRSRGARYLSFVDLVRRQLSQVYAEEDLRSEGLRVFTTLAPFEQEKAQAAVSRGLADLAQRGLSSELQGALVLADTATGEVRALVGDRDGDRPGFNRAIHARRQVGSVIKPLVYLLALLLAASISPGISFDTSEPNWWVPLLIIPVEFSIMWMPNSHHVGHRPVAL